MKWLYKVKKVTKYILETVCSSQGCVSSDNCHYNVIHSYLGLSLLIISSSDKLLIRSIAYIWEILLICKIVYIVFSKMLPFYILQISMIFRCWDPLCRCAIHLNKKATCVSHLYVSCSTLLSVISHSLIFHVYVMVKTAFHLQSNFWDP